MKDKQDITLLIADDHPMLLKGLYEELVAKNYHVIGQAMDGMQALEGILTQRPTLALLDIDMPLLTGFEVIKTAREKGVETKFIVLSFHKRLTYITQAKALHIHGYLLKEDSFFEIERCIQAVLEGHTYFSASFGTLALENAGRDLKKLRLLTPSELTILKLVSKQESTNAIADKLGVSVRTVEKHRSNIIGKLALEGGTNTLTNWALTNKETILEL
ncbi:response regulator transcription factor [Flavobacteriaceae bacterium 3-367]